VTKHSVSSEEAEIELGRILSEKRIQFQKLCNPKRNEGDTEIVHGVRWKVCKSEREFDNLFWDYWNYLREQWMQSMNGEKPGPDWMKTVGETFAKLADNKEKYPGGFKQLWKERGQSMLDLWKRDGVPPNDFLAFASGYFDFERGVKAITGENRLDRALLWFRRFLKSRCSNEDMAQSEIAKYRKEGFASRAPWLLKNEFAKWKREEKSRNAKMSREARGKRGRVRSKSDKRLGARI
jgi:hypothetical protein